VWSLPLIRQGKLKGLGITTGARSALAADMPTIAESGVPGFESTSWIGLVVPAKTPDAPVRRLNEALSAVLDEPELAARIAQAGAEPATARGPEGFRKLLTEDIARWEAVLREGKIVLQ
jgi:tripartite-type tricarboxylate transporter receptor subunit TctC